MAIFNSYVSLPEGIISLIIGESMVLMGRTMMFIRETHVFYAKTPTQEKTELKKTKHVFQGAIKTNAMVLVDVSPNFLESPQSPSKPPGGHGE